MNALIVSPNRAFLGDMSTSLVLTAIGDDRPGLVEAIARTVAEHGGNWVESRMSRLGGKFAGILLVDVGTDHRDALVRALQGLSHQGLRVQVEPSTKHTPPSTKPVRLELLGQDRPGIVRDVSRALSQRGVNVERLNTECISAPMSGEMLFKASAELQLPAGVKLAELRASLETIANELMVDIVLED
jgi:glycine cleavage system regulatory protein